MTTPSLSVVVPNYNHGQHLPNCLEALVRQSVPPAEIVVIDDASTDNSLEVLADFARRYPLIRVLRNERNQGVVYNLNRGIELATGDYLFFPAADDEVKPGFFEKSLALLGCHPQAALSCTVSEWHDVASGLSWHMASGMAAKPCYLSPEDLVQVSRRGKLLIVSASAIFRKGPLVQAGGFIPKLRWHCDWYATFVAAFRHGLCFVPEPLSDFYLYPGSYYNRGRKTEEHRQVLSTILDRLSSPDCADIAPLIRRGAALSLFGLPVLRLLLSNARYRQFLTPLLVWSASRRSAELVGKKTLPKPLARLVLRLLYRHNG